jgi:hypothetical protein
MQLPLIGFVSLLLFGRVYASGQPAGTVYQVEPRSKGNTITLDVTNKLPSALSDLSVAVLRPPSWVRIQSATVDSSLLPLHATAHITVVFDILQDVQRGEAGEVTIALVARKTLVMQKTISLTVPVPTEYELTQNYPNPFNPTTTINYQVPADGFVTLKVFDLLGREVVTLVNEQQKADYYKVGLDASRLASGVYFYRLQGGEFTAVKRLMVLK